VFNCIIVIPPIKGFVMSSNYIGSTIPELQVSYLRLAIERSLRDRRGCPDDAALFVAANLHIEHEVDSDIVTPLDLEIIAEALASEFSQVVSATYELATIFGDMLSLGLDKYVNADGSPNDMELAAMIVERYADVFIDEAALDEVDLVKASPEGAALIEELKAANPGVFALCEAFGVED
jgi:hypothetical protein